MLEEKARTTDSRQQRFRLDTRIHDLLMLRPKPPKPSRKSELEKLPFPVFPQHPKWQGDVEPNPEYLPEGENPYRRRINLFILQAGMQGQG